MLTLPSLLLSLLETGPPYSLKIPAVLDVCPKSWTFSQFFCMSLPTVSFIKTQLTCHYVCSLPACPPFPSPSFPFSPSSSLFLPLSFCLSLPISLRPSIPPSSPRGKVATAPFFPFYSSWEPATFYGVGQHATRTVIIVFVYLSLWLQEGDSATLVKSLEEHKVELHLA